MGEQRKTCRCLAHIAAAAITGSLAGCGGTEPAPSSPSATPTAATESAAPSAESVNLRLVGRNDLQGRSAYQPVVHRYGDRRILFVGHHAGEALNPMTGLVEKNGLSILDVTNPAAPRYLAHMPPTGPDASGTQHVQVCDGSALPAADDAKVYAIRTNGQLAYELIDVTDPAAPTFLATIAETGTSSRPHSDRGDRETHKFQWDCATGIAYLNGTAPGWRVTRVLQAFDVGNPSAPRHIRDFGLVGYEPTAAGPYPEPQIAGLHQPFVVGNRMYLGYNSGDDGTLQIVDRDKFLSGPTDAARAVPGSSSRPAIAAQPIPPTADNLRDPEIARVDFPSYWGAHTAKPIYGFEIADYADNRDARLRDLLLVASESETFRCQEPRDVMMIFDITEEAHPLPIATFQVPEEPGDFCHRGGRFGPHSFADAYHPAFDKKLVVLAYFNAGVRVVDIRNPFEPREVAHFIPEITANTTESCIEIDGTQQCDRAIQTNNVNLDDRGYIFAVDRASTGLHVLELTGAARAIAGL
jgi:LVIVD repeat